jgi:hypothetical protein
LLALVAVACLLPAYRAWDPDATRLCLSRAIVHGELTISPCLADSVDFARYEGRVYSDKAPGMSVLAIPAVEATRLGPATGWISTDDLRVWAVRVLSSGIAFVLLTAAVGRVSEGLAAGSGAPVLVTFATGTLVGPLAATTFGHVTAAALAFAAFLLAWRRRPGLAGLAAGVAVTVEYQTGAVAAILALYVALAGLHALGRYVVGLLPSALLLGAYDWAAFGSPFHLSYRYVANAYAAEQQSGFFGVHVPTLEAAREVFVGNRGLLVVAPVVVAAAAGLVLLWRSRRAEAGVAAAVVAFFVLLNCGYFIPYGGTSPGPRFLTPALPFLALGLACAFARWRLATSVLASVSIAGMSLTTLTWTASGRDRLVWSNFARIVTDTGRSELAGQLTSNALSWAGLGPVAGAVIVAGCATAAYALALLGQTRMPR